MSSPPPPKYVFDLNANRWYIHQWIEATQKWSTEWMPTGWEPDPVRSDSVHSPNSSPLLHNHAAGNAASPTAAGPTPGHSSQATLVDSSLPREISTAYTGYNQAQQYYTHQPQYAGPSNWHQPSGAQPFVPQGTEVAQRLPRGEGLSIAGTYAEGTRGASKSETVDPSFRVRRRAFFVEGRVFAIIMAEAAGEQAAMDYNSSLSGARNVSPINRHNLTPVKYKDFLVHTQTRRFVVVRQKREFCFGCPIFTYGGKATTKRGVHPEEHGIAYSMDTKPALVANERGITKPSIGVTMVQGEQSLDVASRIYYGIHHPIQYNVKVKDIGLVAKQHIPALISNWRSEQGKEMSRVYEEEEEAESDEEDVENPPPSQQDPFIYNPVSNTWGYHSSINPHVYHPQNNPDGYHPTQNKTGYHPQSNPYSYHPEHNPYGYHARRAPFCYHPTFSPHGYHYHMNPGGYHPSTAPHNYHPTSNPHGFHPDFNLYGYHPNDNPSGYHPDLRPGAYHPEYNPNGAHESSDDDEDDDDYDDNGEENYGNYQGPVVI